MTAQLIAETFLSCWRACAQKSEGLLPLNLLLPTGLALCLVKLGGNFQNVKLREFKCCVADHHDGGRGYSRQMPEGQSGAPAGGYRRSRLPGESQARAAIDVRHGPYGFSQKVRGDEWTQ